ncbi:glycosyltransferase family 2 protein [Sulfitobacter sp. JB4-11]|uniref:glycosyltransferase family 2 protein n=1 Tax=Sulfitobacter rhodophyticola TaxID=3238304 RepID=UPI00351191C0
MKISIVIPTRERAQYLLQSVQTALAIDDPDLEIVVSDNASMDGTDDLMRQFDDPRLVYVNTGARLSMRQNFEYAFNASTGAYLVFFGDDDGILPGQFRFLRALVEKHKPDGLSWRKATYGWPVEGYGKKTGGIRFYRDSCFGGAQSYKGRDNLTKLLTADVTALRPVPDIYHGCLSRDYMIRTSMDSETVFDSTIPDVNLTYRAILKDGDFIHVDHPLSINGYSPASTGGGFGAEQKGQSTTQTAQTFASENQTDRMGDVLPHAGSVPLAFFSTLETLRRNHGLERFEPDYTSWYRFVMGVSGSNPVLADKLRGILEGHATATGTQPALNAALAGPRRTKRSKRERLTRVADQFHSFRLSAADGTENTILTAAHTMDAVLGDDLGAVLSGGMTRRTAWKAAKRRSKRFQRQL